VGTHADAPLHFIPQGKGIDAGAARRPGRPARVLNFTPCKALQEIDVPQLQEKLGGKVPARIILRTDWSDHFGQMPF